MTIYFIDFQIWRSQMIYSSSLNPGLLGKWSCQELIKILKLCSQTHKGKAEVVQRWSNVRAGTENFGKVLEKKNNNNQRKKKRGPIKHHQWPLKGSAFEDLCVSSGIQMCPSPVSLTSERASRIVNTWRFSGNEQFQGLGWATDACPQRSAAT